MNVRIFKALGNETRLKIIEILLIKSHNVTDLTLMCKKDQTTISRHLSNLVNSGIINQRKIGRNVFYKIASVKIKDWLQATLGNKKTEVGNYELRGKIANFLTEQRVNYNGR